MKIENIEKESVIRMTDLVSYIQHHLDQIKAQLIENSISTTDTEEVVCYSQKLNDLATVIYLFNE